MPNPSRLTHSTQRLRPLLRFDYYADTNAYTLRIDTPAVGYHLWDTTTHRWIWSNDIDTDITARVFTVDGGQTWHAYTRVAGTVRRNRYRPSSSPGVLMRKIEDWAVRRFKLYAFQVTDASQLQRQGEFYGYRRTINGRHFPPGTDAIVLTDGTPLADTQWSQTITPTDSGFVVQIRIGEGRETILTSGDWAETLRVANQQFNNFVGLRRQVQVQLPRTHDRPRVGSHNFAQYIEQPSLPAGWAEGWQ